MAIVTQKALARAIARRKREKTGMSSKPRPSEVSSTLRSNLGQADRQRTNDVRNPMAMIPMMARRRRGDER
jgi:hypothetical protein